MLRSGVKPGLDLQRSGCRRRFSHSLGEAELRSTRVYLIAFFFFFPTASGHAQWAHTCPTLPHGSSEKMPTTSEVLPPRPTRPKMSQRSFTRQSLTGWRCVRRPSLSFIEVLPKEQGRANGPVPPCFLLSGAKKGCLSFLFLLPFRCSHTITRRDAQECERVGDGCRNARLFFPVQDGPQFSDANLAGRSSAALSNDARCECRARHCSAKIPPQIPLEGLQSLPSERQPRTQRLTFLTRKAKKNLQFLARSSVECVGWKREPAIRSPEVCCRLALATVEWRACPRRNYAQAPAPLPHLPKRDFSFLFFFYV